MIHMWFPAGGIPLRSQANSMMCLAVGRKRAHHKVLSTVWELHTYTLTGPVVEDIYHHPLLVGRLQLGPDCATVAEENPDCLTNIGLYPQTIKQPGEGVE